MSMPGARTSTAHAVADHVRRQIHTGRYASGDRLPSQRDLALDLGVSRASVSGGLKLLVDSGYLVVRRGATGGAFVTELSQPVETWKLRLRNLAGELSELTELRVAVECELARLAADRATDRDLQSMARANDALAAARRADVDDARALFRAADTDFHAALAAAAGSSRLADLAQQARSELFTPYDVLDFEEPIEVVLADHRRIHRAVRAGSCRRASEVMREHIYRTRDQLASFVVEDDASDLA